MARASVNKIAKNNGEFGEKVAPKILEIILTPEIKVKLGNILFVNDLIDFYSESGIPIEVKTCQEWIERGDNRPTACRLGRFVLDKDQHDYLTLNDGYYLFIVKNESLVMRARLLKAEDITFQRNLLWRLLWD